MVNRDVSHCWWQTLASHFLYGSLAEERQYVLGILFRMRDEVDANPDFFDSDAQERIDEAIALLQSPGEKASAA